MAELYNNNRNGLNTAASLNSSISTSSLVDLPNLPGVRRDVSLINPKLYKQFKASQSSRGGSVLEEDNNSFVPEENSLLSSYFEDANKFELTRTLSPFPLDGRTYNDVSGRYSIVSQRRDRVEKKLGLPYSSTESLPPFVTNSSHVAHFLAYFDEAATDATEERSRKVEIRLYLEDNSIEIIEPRVENSGTLQGKFLKRHQIFKPVTRIPSDKSRMVYTINDFFAGSQLEIYNRTYTVVDCDNSTKAYMENMGLDFGRPLPLPKTIYDPKTRPSMSRPVTRTSTRTKRRAGFFDYDRKVLRFYGIWDSTSMLFGDVIKVKLHYTLADDKIDISAIPDRNSGRDPQTTLLKKSVVMKRSTPFLDPGNVGAGRRSREGGSRSSTPEKNFSPSSSLNNSLTAGEKDRPYHWKDLAIGEIVSVASLNVLLTDADEFTRDFYNSNGMPLGPPIAIPEPNYEQLSASFSVPDDDASTLIPLAPVKDGLKAQLFQGMVLRYRAKIHNPREADKSREFIIQVHLEDDTFQIREPPIRNSGHKGGIFLARCKVDYLPGKAGPANPDSLDANASLEGSVAPEKKFLEPSDVFVGATVSILSHKFDILDCDQYTFKYMEANPNLWKFSDLKSINSKLSQRKETITKVILTDPSLQSKSITAEDLEVIFKRRCHLELVKQEIFTVFRAVDTFRVGTVKLTKFLKYMMDLR